MICILDIIGLIGFAILNCIVGGQALASVADGDLSWRYIPSYSMCGIEDLIHLLSALVLSLLQRYPFWYRSAELQFLIGLNTQHAVMR